MKHARLDKIDMQILKMLQEDGRKTNVNIAKAVGISAPPCLRRVKALEDNGFIKGYHAELDHTALGYSVTLLAQVKLSSHAEKDLAEFVDHIDKSPMVRESYMVAGEMDFILKVVARDWDEYQEFLTKHLTTAPHVTSVKSSLCIRTTKNEPGVPINVE